jgi:hypothetical protein
MELEHPNHWAQIRVEYASVSEAVAIPEWQFVGAT